MNKEYKIDSIKTGDTVICVNAQDSSLLKEGHEYIVTELYSTVEEWNCFVNLGGFGKTYFSIHRFVKREAFKTQVSDYEKWN